MTPSKNNKCNGLAGEREKRIRHLCDQENSDASSWDIVIVGGGITGAGVLREATRKGLKAILVEQRDFAWGTSSKSSKMVHGGLRYLASGQFSLTRDSVKERQRLLTEVPGLVSPLPFLMGHYTGQFPGPLIFNILLMIYDWMAGHKNHRFIHSGIRDFFAPGLRKESLKGVTQFSDAVTDDARLVMRVLQEARKEGGEALNYVRADKVLRAHGNITGIRVQDQETGVFFTLQARCVVNATGAWADQLRSKQGKDAEIRPLRGSHLIFPAWRLPVAESISFFHPADKRPVFVFPWEGVTVVGTTDLDHQESLANESRITSKEVDYLLAGANFQFPESQVSAEDVTATYSGVRPVVGTGSLNPSKEKREHVIWDDEGVVSVAGGKLTTFRLIALDVLASAAKYLPIKQQEGDNLVSEEHCQARIFEEIDDSCLPDTFLGLSSFKQQRLLGRYGNKAIAQFSDVYLKEYLPGQTVHTTHTLWSELAWCAANESVVHLEDLMLRRTRIGLLLPQGGKTILAEVKNLCQPFLQWDDQRWNQEQKAYLALIASHYGLPTSTDPIEVKV